MSDRPLANRVHLAMSRPQADCKGAVPSHMFHRGSLQISLEACFRIALSEAQSHHSNVVNGTELPAMLGRSCLADSLVPRAGAAVFRHRDDLMRPTCFIRSQRPGFLRYCHIVSQRGPQTHLARLIGFAVPCPPAADAGADRTGSPYCHLEPAAARSFHQRVPSRLQPHKSLAR
ncbi:hypothetical protein EJ04DRAFT_139079 [Polyplosphaeria fusca]|uniref:Uncharacterized protein n=1 Tax=Polyplosphaeria fusca TaxID=682080 RepID=A0A9P4QZY9_9PLEO|nr:hypothetical protein EJ04DRAFT_139079 [Polyplosphaeria fusca]